MFEPKQWILMMERKQLSGDLARASPRQKNGDAMSEKARSQRGCRNLDGQKKTGRRWRCMWVALSTWRYKMWLLWHLVSWKWCYELCLGREHSSNCKWRGHGIIFWKTKSVSHQVQYYLVNYQREIPSDVLIDSYFRDSCKATHFLAAKWKKFLKVRPFILTLEYLPRFHSKKRMEPISWSRCSKSTWQEQEAQENAGPGGSERRPWQGLEAAECKWSLRNISGWLCWWKMDQMMQQCREPSGVAKESGMSWVDVNERSI